MTDELYPSVSLSNESVILTRFIFWSIDHFAITTIRAILVIVVSDFKISAFVILDLQGIRIISTFLCKCFYSQFQKERQTEEKREGEKERKGRKKN